MTEGVDYSRTASSNWVSLAKSLKSAGKEFAGRYAVLDKSPDGRGITGAEYRALRAAGVDVFLYYEETTSWMNNGWNAGVRAANRALAVIKAEGLPEGMPVYYSCDTPPEETNFPALIDCMNGAKSVVGFDRLGFYGGYDAVKYVADRNASKFYCQTYAWSGVPPVWHPSCHLQQYDNYDNYIAGTDVDLVRSVKANYGQASVFDGGGIVYAKPIPAPLKDGKPYPHIDANNIVWLEVTPRRWTALEQTERRQRANETAAEVGPPVKQGEIATFIYSVAMPDGSVWFISKAGSRCRADAFIPEAP